MTRFILRTVLTTLALVLLFAGSFNLNRTSATAIRDDGDVIVDPAPAPEPAPISDCLRYAGCNGGPTFCGVIHYPNGAKVECGMH
jgi:hypothetical protein